MTNKYNISVAGLTNVIIFREYWRINGYLDHDIEMLPNHSMLYDLTVRECLGENSCNNKNVLQQAYLRLYFVTIYICFLNRWTA